MSDAWFVIGRQDVGEADRIVRFLTPQQGQIDVYVRRARSSARRFAGCFDVGNLVAVQLKESRTRLPNLVSADLVASPQTARGTLEGNLMLSWGCEVIGVLTSEGKDTGKLYKLLEVWIALIEQEGPPAAAGRLAMESKALTFAGLTPVLTRCAVSGASLDDPCAFVPDQGGGVRMEYGHRRVARRALYGLEALRRAPMADHWSESAPHPHAFWLMADFIEHHTGKGLRCRALLGELMGSMEKESK